MTRLNFNRPNQKHWILFMRLCLIGAIAFICFGSIKPNLNTGVEVSDKILHFMAYGALAGLIGTAFPRLSLLKVFLIASLFGASMEILQHVAPTGRDASMGDQIANTGGAFTAVAVWSLIVFINYMVWPKKTPLKSVR